MSITSKDAKAPIGSPEPLKEMSKLGNLLCGYEGPPFDIL
jgi:hypothetical protein